MRYVNPLNSEFETRPAGLRRRGVVALVMLVWLVYWAGMFSQACCQPQFQGGHPHSSGMDDHDEHHEVVVAAHEHDVPTDYENCAELTRVDLVSLPSEATMESAPQPVHVATNNTIIPEQVFSTAVSFTYTQQSHPPPNRFLRSRRLLI